MQRSCVKYFQVVFVKRGKKSLNMLTDWLVT